MSELNSDSQEFINLAGEILASGHRLRFRARGVSMRPTIRDGDLLEVTSVETTHIRTGDVLLYKIANRQILVHRVIRIQYQEDQLHFLIQGDASPQPDGWIPPEQILGKVIKIEHSGHLINLDSKFQRLMNRAFASGLPVYKQIRLRLLKLK